MEIIWHPKAVEDMERLFSPSLRYAIPRWISDTRWEIFYAWQRVFRGYDDRMIFGFHSEFVRMVIPVLKAVREDKMGVPYMVEVGGDAEGANWDEHKRVWHEQLDIMIRGFEAAARLDNADNWEASNRNVEEKRRLDEQDHKLFEAGMDSFKKHFFSLWT